MKPLTIGVAGGSGSGKSTVVHALMQAVGQENTAFLPHDAYYRDYRHLSIEERTQVNWDHPDALETELMARHLAQLAAWQSVERPLYDFRDYTRMPETERVEPRPVIIVEGILILVEPDLRDMLDIKAFVDTDADIRFIRRLQRDMLERGRSVSSVVEQYLGTVRPMHLDFVEPSKRYADIIIPRGGHNRVAIEMLVARVRSALAAGK
ncbi:MAG: uridine kinase [Chloroflexota bacterium]|nr:uridine kinase [Chloroflexota bacterium]MDQ5864606.1 uridine kinase [Chloroflexota bacterium]